VATSLPELAVAIAAVRTGSYDLAVGNLLGSNCFNMVVLLGLDLADGPGALLGSVEASVAVAALFAILLMSQVLVEVLHRSEERIWFLEPNALLLIAVYAIGLFAVYQSGAPGQLSLERGG
jgi:cation:H+ antiporter